MVPLPLQASLPRKAMQMGNVPPTTLTAHRQPHKPGAPRGFPNVMPEISRPVHHSRGHSGSGWMGENPGWGGVLPDCAAQHKASLSIHSHFP